MVSWPSLPIDTGNVFSSFPLRMISICMRLVVDGGDQLLGNGEAGLGAAGVDVDHGAGRPEVLRPPAHLGVARPVEPAGHRRVRRDVDGLLGHRPVSDRPLEVDVDRLGDADDGTVDRVERRRHEHRLADVRRRVLAGRRALRDAAAAWLPADPPAAAGTGSGGRTDSGVAEAERPLRCRRKRWWRRVPLRRSAGAGGGGGTSGSASADGLPSAAAPISPAAKIAVTSLPLVRCRIRHLQSQTSSSLAQRDDRLPPRRLLPEPRPSSRTRPLSCCVHRTQGVECYFLLVA